MKEIIIYVPIVRPSKELINQFLIDSIKNHVKNYYTVGTLIIKYESLKNTIINIRNYRNKGRVFIFKIKVIYKSEDESAEKITLLGISEEVNVYKKERVIFNTI